jgi:histidine triad (HIT) family protein
MGCLFCNMVEKKIPADVVYEDDHALAFRDIRPMAPTHVLVVPKKHVAATRALGEGEVELAGRLLLAAAQTARKLGLEAGGYRLVINDGDDAGQSVHHIHVHVLGGRTLAWPPG